MGNHPGDLISFLSSLSPSIPQTGHNLLLKDVLDQRISSPIDQFAEEVVFVAKLAFGCLRIDPHSRPTMRQVSQDLSARRPHLRKMFDRITLNEVIHSA